MHVIGQVMKALRYVLVGRKLRRTMLKHRSAADRLDAAVRGVFRK